MAHGKPFSRVHAFSFLALQVALPIATTVIASMMLLKRSTVSQVCICAHQGVSYILSFVADPRSVSGARWCDQLVGLSPKPPSTERSYRRS